MNNRKIWAIAFVEGKETPIKLRMTKKDLKAFYYWLDRNYSSWTAVNVYERNSFHNKGNFIKQLKKCNYWFNLQFI